MLQKKCIPQCKKVNFLLSFPVWVKPTPVNLIPKDVTFFSEVNDKREKQVNLSNQRSLNVRGHSNIPIIRDTLGGGRVGDIVTWGRRGGQPKCHVTFLDVFEQNCTTNSPENEKTSL